MTNRLLFSHNYSMVDARAGYEAGLYPAQHLYGTTGLDGVVDEIIDVPFCAEGRDRPARAWVAARFGEPGQQMRMLADRVRRRGDAIWYSGEWRTLDSLMLLRRAHLVRTPVVVVVHDAPAGRIDAACLRGADMIVCVSRRVADELIDETGIAPDRVVVAPWGPDLEFPGYRSAGSDFVLSVGKSQRDLPTLLMALERTRLPARIYAEADVADIWSGRLPEVRFSRTQPTEAIPGVLTYEHVLGDLQHAAVFAVALHEPRRPYGITELNDALALGKPIVMTRNPFIDCDIEAVGCGIWVDEGDVDGWARALERLMRDPADRDAMGRRGREFAEREWNAERFAAALRDAIARTSRGAVSSDYR